MSTTAKTPTSPSETSEASEKTSSSSKSRNSVRRLFGGGGSSTKSAKNRVQAGSTKKTEDILKNIKSKSAQKPGSAPSSPKKASATATTTTTPKKESSSSTPTAAAATAAAVATVATTTSSTMSVDTAPDTPKSADEASAAAAELKQAATVESAATTASRALTEKQQQHVQTHQTWLTRTKMFQNMCTKAFAMIDTDKSGTVDEKELYSGLLLIHLKLGMYAGPAACRPLGRERCLKVFRHFDDNGDGTLGPEEFEGVMMVLFSNVLFRVLVQWAMTIIIVPIVANHVLEAFYWTMRFLYLCVVNADEYLAVANSIELFLEGIVAWIWERTPTWMVVCLDAFVDAWQAVPDSVWNAAPLSLLSAILGILVVPWIIIKVDDFFQWLAERADTDGSGFKNEEEEAKKKSPTFAEVSKKEQAAARETVAAAAAKMEAKKDN